MDKSDQKVVRRMDLLERVNVILGDSNRQPMWWRLEYNDYCTAELTLEWYDCTRIYTFEFSCETSKFEQADFNEMIKLEDRINYL